MRAILIACVASVVVACSTPAQSPDGGDLCGGCDAGFYCWPYGFGECLANGTCPGGGVDSPMPGLCSCDGYLVTPSPCDAGQTCPTPAHGHTTFCQ
jgi:hypothetical protein